MDYFGDPEGFFFIEDQIKLKNIVEAKKVDTFNPSKSSLLTEREWLREDH